MTGVATVWRRRRYTPWQGAGGRSSIWLLRMRGYDWTKYKSTRVSRKMRPEERQRKCGHTRLR
jgi:hypothetical protein